MAACMTAGVYAANCNTNLLSETFTLIAQRAQLMEQVALNKYNNKQNPFAAAQEIKVLQRAQQLAKKEGFALNPLLVFTQMQMDLSKYIQQYWMDQWQKAPADKLPGITLTLDQVRERIGYIDKALYPSLKKALPSLKRCPIVTSSKLFSQSMAKVKGVPQDPDYNQVILNSLITVAQAHQ